MHAVSRSVRQGEPPVVPWFVQQTI